jgi:hypothetical protein
VRAAADRRLAAERGSWRAPEPYANWQSARCHLTAEATIHLAPRRRRPGPVPSRTSAGCSIRCARRRRDGTGLSSGSSGSPSARWRSTGGGRPGLSATPRTGACVPSAISKLPGSKPSGLSSPRLSARRFSQARTHHGHATTTVPPPAGSRFVTARPIQRPRLSPRRNGLCPGEISLACPPRVGEPGYRSAAGGVSVSRTARSWVR